MREVVGKTPVDSVLSQSTSVANQAGQYMQAMLKRYAVGITINNITISQVQPPEQVQAAFNDAIKADQDGERQKNEGEAYRNNVVPRAIGAASRLKAESEGYKQSVIARAEGDAARFRQLVAEYNKAPGVTRQRLYIDAMQQIYSNTTKVYVDQKAGNNLLYLPLDKLIQRVNADAMQPSTLSVTGAPATTPDAARALTPESGREGLRSRDREARP
jgi:membrane protease subunit HflK